MEAVNGMADETTVSEETIQDDLNKLVGTALGLAQEQLEQHGAFLPVALVVAADGEVQLVAVGPGEDPDSADGVEPELDADAMIADLYEVLRQQRAGNRAAAVVCDIHLPDENSDAIHVVAEHSGGVSIAAVQPYTPPAEAEAEAGFTFADPIWEPGEKLVWS
ncbi:hypothetical protein [Arthrobacter sp. 35W]|uniref:hypothetical protein n=1 Tax=Arthrobacter sp. 35W TaxID=1132441 RepID=UPI0003FEE89F|nr:hypothetical protein [Arthrobacter sp. 35W]